MRIKTSTQTRCSRNVPELRARDFVERIDSSKYSWIHMEARKNASELVQMIGEARAATAPADDSSRGDKRLAISVEIEKPTKSREVVLQEDVDYFFFSKDFARWKGASHPDSCMQVLSQVIPKSRSSPVVLICAWAQEGARAALIESGGITRHFSSPSFPPRHGVLDTTGAGDSFIAATVFALQVMQLDVGEAIRFGCRFAGAKCGTHGNQGLEDFEQFL